jgi:diguanylate cyclase (GGDEF)-like protein/PAS domain S-box-containing protein
MISPIAPTNTAADHDDLLASLPNGVLVLKQGVILWANPAILLLLEATGPQDLLGRIVTDFVYAADQSHALQRLQKQSPGDDALPPTQYRVQTCNGNIRIFLVSSRPMRYRGSDAILVAAMDMTDHIAMEERLRVSEQNFRRLFENMQDVYYRTDAQGVVQMVGPGVRRVLGFEPEEIVGRTAESYYPHSSDRDAFKRVIQEKGEAADFPGQMVRKDGQVIDISISSHALRDENGRFCGVEGIYRDVTQRKNLERALQRLATTDPLTGISNRRDFMDKAMQAFHVAQRYHQTLALLMLDLDHFKSINDLHGHAAGDEALLRFAHVVEPLLRESDLFGRLGGEEFCIVMQSAQSQEANLVAQRIRDNLQNFVFQDAAGQDYHVTVSIGITFNHADDKHVQKLIDRADKALYQAKHDGRNRVFEQP